MQGVSGSSPLVSTKNSREQSDREFLLITSSLFTFHWERRRNFEVKCNSENGIGESYLGSDMSPNTPPKNNGFQKRRALKNSFLESMGNEHNEEKRKIRETP